MNQRSMNGPKRINTRKDHTPIVVVGVVLVALAYLIRELILWL